MKPKLILGLMSGTSLDGLDMAFCKFENHNGQIKFNLIASETLPYDANWKMELQLAHQLNSESYFKLHHQYGLYIADSVNRFLQKNNLKPDYIASHGHTIFHKPESGFSTQIGCGATIAANTGIPVICDFRSADVALGGQGAPLVPIGDRDLFYEYESCLNIGGIANLSYTKNGVTKAFDVCVANMALNYLSETKQKPFDEGGALAEQGVINHLMLKQLLVIDSKNLSLGREFFESRVIPLINSNSVSIEDRLTTYVEYCAIMISGALKDAELNSVLISGGGAYNTFLVNRIKHYYQNNIHIPTKEIIEFKEAIIFAYLGYLRLNNKINTLKSVTGAKEDSIGGCVYDVINEN